MAYTAQNCRPIPDCVIVLNSGDTNPSILRGVITFNANTLINWRDIVPNGVISKCAATPVAQIDTLIPVAYTPTSDCCGLVATYSVTITIVSCGETIPFTFTKTYNTDASANSIATDFVTAINGSNIPVTAVDTTGDFTLTSDVAGLAFITTVSSNIASSTTTANVLSWGQAADLTYDGVTAASGVVYHSIDVPYTVLKPLYEDANGYCADCYKVCNTSCRIYYSDNAGGDTIQTAMSTILTGASTAALYFGKSAALVC
jgi:hypothetical protein